MSRWSLQSVDANRLHLRLGLGLGAAIAVLAFILLVKLLLPWLLLLVGIGLLGYGWYRQRRFQQRLYRCFYYCLARYQGKISALDFAIAAHITGPQARAFLDDRAKDFFAEFEPTAHGDILYTFRQTPIVPVSSASTPIDHPSNQLRR